MKKYVTHEKRVCFPARFLCSLQLAGFHFRHSKIIFILKSCKGGGGGEHHVAWADPVLGKLGACLMYKISDILESLMRCSFTIKL